MPHNLDKYAAGLVRHIDATIAKLRTVKLDREARTLTETIASAKVTLSAASGATYEEHRVAPDGSVSLGKPRGGIRLPALTPPPPPSSFPASFDGSASRPVYSPTSTAASSPSTSFLFEVLHESKFPGSRARVGRITTPHGIVDTPGFVPVATNAALKAVDHDTADAAADHPQLMFSNTFHLLVHPGTDIIRRAGGIHKFMGRRRDRPMITDSGGFQVFSLDVPDIQAQRGGEAGRGNGRRAGDGPELKSRTRERKGQKRPRSGVSPGTSPGSSSESASTNCPPSERGCVVSIDERGVVFRSYRDGSLIKLTPESSVRAQKDIGADIIIPLDELPSHHVTPDALAESVSLSHRWMCRSLREHLRDPAGQAMYGVVHGGTDRDLRRSSVEYLSSLPFDGMAIGGSLGKDRGDMIDMLRYMTPLLPPDRPRHLLGIGDPTSVAAAVPLGIDTFDSCLPTRVARHGTAFLEGFIIYSV
jgi:queuine tRNA-ribosyltransferase